MTQLWRAIVVLSVGVASASPRDFVPFFGQREQRSLVNTFPFNNVDSQVGMKMIIIIVIIITTITTMMIIINTFPFNKVDSQLPERETRQGLDNSVSSIPFSAVASSYAGGKR